MSYLISLAIGIAVGLAYHFLDFRSPAPPLVALVGLLGMQIVPLIPSPTACQGPVP